MSGNRNWWDILLNTAKEERLLAAKKKYSFSMRKLELLAKHYDESIMRKVIDALTDADNAGYAIAGYRLGTLCEHRNFERAIDYYEVARVRMRRMAQEGDSEAALCLAELYHYGRGVEENERQARLWLKKAIELGNVDALHEGERWEQNRRKRNENILIKAMLCAERAHEKTP